MTAYVVIPGSDIDQDSPVTQPLLTALRDNPLAQFEGATGAPRLLGYAVARLNNGLPVMTIAASNAAIINYGLATATLTTVTTSTSLVAAFQATMVAYTGSVRCNASHQSSGGISTLAIYLNGIQIASWTTNSSTPIARTFDMSISGSAVIEWRHSSNSSYPSTVSNISFTASDAYVYVPVLIPASAA